MLRFFRFRAPFERLGPGGLEVWLDGDEQDGGPTCLPASEELRRRVEGQTLQMHARLTSLELEGLEVTSARPTRRAPGGELLTTQARLLRAQAHHTRTLVDEGPQLAFLLGSVGHRLELDWKGRKMEILASGAVYEHALTLKLGAKVWVQFKLGGGWETWRGEAVRVPHWEVYCLG